MQTATQEQKQKQSIYSILNYQGQRKWCFAIVLNRALDNINPKRETETGKYKNKELFYKSLLRFEGIKKQPWFDETKAEKENVTAKEIIDSKDKAAELLLNLRNYFSHNYHTEKCLYFGTESQHKQIRESQGGIDGKENRTGDFSRSRKRQRRQYKKVQIE